MYDGQEQELKEKRKCNKCFQEGHVQKDCPANAWAELKVDKWDDKQWPMSKEFGTKAVLSKEIGTKEVLSKEICTKKVLSKEIGTKEVLMQEMGCAQLSDTTTDSEDESGGESEQNEQKQNGIETNDSKNTTRKKTEVDILIAKKIAEIKAMQEQEINVGEQQNTASEQQNSGASEQQHTGANEQQNTGASEQQNTGASEQQNTGASEQQNTGASEQQNTGASEQQNTDTSEQQNIVEFPSEGEIDSEIDLTPFEYIEKALGLDWKLENSRSRRKTRNPKHRQSPAKTAKERNGSVKRKGAEAGQAKPAKKSK
jgi:hypothetical protein